ncbi:MAG: glycerol-3-phosphate dehydrogenase [Alphaproteobacteria bacterium]|nr:glycerol-3-phosphate dehydrogenase [Alphaproteobacteria bacterium]
MYDLCVIGGGINGVGVARDAAGRGYKVLLVEQGDLASVTSSASTKLIHGGLRYLEQFAFRLVRESLREREVLCQMAPHLVHPLRFVLPHQNSVRPAWMVRAGLFLYDHLGGEKNLSRSRMENLREGSLGKFLRPELKRGFSYSDCRVDDARLVILNAVDAAQRGAVILTRTMCEKIIPDCGAWALHLKDLLSGESGEVRAKYVVNAAGPYVRDVLDNSNLSIPNQTPRLRLVQGSHIVVPSLFEGDHAYILQQPDRRVVFAIPYQGCFTLIGTTDTEFTGDARGACVTTAEQDYLCAAVNRYFLSSVTTNQIIWSYSGVRALFDDGRKNARSVTRDYHLYPQRKDGSYILSVFGGKLTTYRKLSEQVCDLLDAEGFSSEGPWTDKVPLCGGDFGGLDFTAFLNQQAVKWPNIPPDTLRRLAGSYGTIMDRILAKPMGKDLGDGLFESEVRYLIEEEWAQTPEDILWRRSKLGLHISEETRKTLESFMSSSHSEKSLTNSL